MTKEILINIKVKTNRKENRVEYDGIRYIVYTTSPAKDNKANISVIKLLSKHLNIPKSNIHIKQGLKSKNKLLVIKDS